LNKYILKVVIIRVQSLYVDMDYVDNTVIRWQCLFLNSILSLLKYCSMYYIEIDISLSLHCNWTAIHLVMYDNMTNVFSLSLGFTV